MKPTVWKLLLILAVVAAAAFFSYPPEDRINLGLDLQGGTYIALQVDSKEASKSLLDRNAQIIKARLDRDGIPHDTVLPQGNDSVEVRGVAEAKRDEVREFLGRFVGGSSTAADPWVVKDLSGGSFRITAPRSVLRDYAERSIENTLSILNKRINGLGVSEPSIQRQMMADRILVQLPGVQDVDRVKELLVARADLDWTEVSYPANVPPAARRSWDPPTSEEETRALFGGTLPEDTRIVPQDIGGGTVLYWPLKRVPTVSGQDVRNAYRSSDEFGAPSVGFDLTADAGATFEAATSRNVGQRMAIVLDGQVISAPVIRNKIRDSGVIQGSFSFDQADDMALKLRSGSMDVTPRIVAERTIGPSLGRDSIRAGLLAGIVGFVGVMLFMVVYYRLAGINAMVALALNVLLVFGALGALPFLFSLSEGVRVTLTLPGIAGLILTVGMAVDSNVLIFERIREELRLGKTVRSAVNQGFSKAFLTILDCNVTTLVAAFFLFFYGTGTPVQGFAVTLTIGLLASMFTAVFVSRQLFELVLSRKGGSATELSI